jgi:hypothetical protein
MKDVRLIWGLPQEDSFMKLKELVTSAPVLVLPNDNLLFRLEADGSGITTGVVLSQQQVDDNVWHPVCKGNLTDLRRILHLSLAKGNPK